jgi:DMSO/TMAO reductase YedYZ molybdopterin-dependent catalytic subunit
LTVRVRAAAVALASLLFAALPGAGVAQVTAPSQLTVKGSVEREVVLSMADLRALPVQRIEDVRSVREAGASGAASNAASGSESVRRYTGCLLRDVLDRAKPVEKKRMDFRKSVIIVTAADGYRTVFSWAELYLSPIGDGALVVYERDGQPLAADEGPLAVVSLKDTRPGPRHVKWLSSIELRLLAE